MAKLILSQVEKEYKNWADLDNESLGKVVKNGMFKLKEINEKNDGLLLMTAATVIFAVAIECNVDRVDISLDDMTRKGLPVGNWKVTIKKTK